MLKFELRFLRIFAKLLLNIFPTHEIWSENKLWLSPALLFDLYQSAYLKFWIIFWFPNFITVVNS